VITERKEKKRDRVENGISSNKFTEAKQQEKKKRIFTDLFSVKRDPKKLSDSREDYEFSSVVLVPFLQLKPR
jgi:hypothetical protein